MLAFLGWAVLVIFGIAISVICVIAAVDGFGKYYAPSIRNTWKSKAFDFLIIAILVFMWHLVSSFFPFTLFL